MMRVFFYASHTLYLKALIPLIELFLENSIECTLNKNHLNLFKYKPSKFSKKPTVNKCINKSSYDFVKSLLMDVKTNKYPDFSFWGSLKKNDVFIATTKDISFLNKIRIKNKNAKIFVVPYQHMPFLCSLSSKLKNKNEVLSASKVFLENNEFSRQHSFVYYLNKEGIKDYTFFPFPYLSSKREKLRCPQKVLIFHPGGYRNIITSQGDNKTTSYECQKAFIQKLCLPLLENGLVPVIKIHPLHAQFHSFSDLKYILDNLNYENTLYAKVELLAVGNWGFVPGFFLTFGSSALYELYSMGHDKVFICDFLGKSRSSKFSMFSDLMIKNIEEYIDFVKSRIWENDDIFRNSLTKDIFKAYSEINSELNIEQILDEVKS